MKIEITPEIKARVFALYYNQQAVVTKGNYTHKQGTTYLIDGDVLSSIGLDALVKYRYAVLVKPLSSITDEDSMDLCKYWYAYPNQRTAENGRSIILSYGKHNGMPMWLVDYLRSKGYALPYMDWSVDELVAEGVFKLKGENNG